MRGKSVREDLNLGIEGKNTGMMRGAIWRREQSGPQGNLSRSGETTLIGTRKNMKQGYILEVEGEANK